MAETIPGGAYLASDGETWIDANGNKLKPEAVARAQQVLAERAEATAAAEQALQEHAALSRNVIVVQAPAGTAERAPARPARSSKEN